MDLLLKKCTYDDLDILCDFSKNMYYDTFKGTCSEGDLLEYIKKAFDRQKILSELNNPSSEFYLLYYNDDIVGYMKLNDFESQTDIKDEKSLEIERIYIIKESQGAGLGSYLISQSISKAKEKGKKYIWLGVWEKNDKAIRFYEKHGFYKIRMHDFTVGEDVQHDYLMRKDI